MILLDLNQTAFSALFAHTRQGNAVDKKELHYIILNCIRSYNVKFKGNGELVIAIDSQGDYWRKELFPYYKAGRKKSRAAKAHINWVDVFDTFERIKTDLIEYFPYRVLNIDRVEADDIIAVLSRHVTDQNILILSGDTDFVQLHSQTVKQYDPVQKRKVSTQNITKYLKEHIIEGDHSDGIPNILSEPDCWVVENKRQKALTAARREYLMNTEPKNYMVEEWTTNFERNKALIDLSLIPEQYVKTIWQTFQETPVKTRKKLFNYFYDNNYTQFMNQVSEF